ncbi:hypothetical protein Tco_0595291 [Tanacetum coccineum]
MKEQKRTWSEVYCGLGDVVAKEYELVCLVFNDCVDGEAKIQDSHPASVSSGFDNTIIVDLFSSVGASRICLISLSICFLIILRSQKSLNAVIEPEKLKSVGVWDCVLRVIIYYAFKLNIAVSEVSIQLNFLVALRYTCTNKQCDLSIHLALLLFTGYVQDDLSGLISIDHGIFKGSKYTDIKTGINYASNDGFVEGGISQQIRHCHPFIELMLEAEAASMYPVHTTSKDVYHIFSGLQYFVLGITTDPIPELFFMAKDYSLDLSGLNDDKNGTAECSWRVDTCVEASREMGPDIEVVRNMISVAGGGGVDNFVVAAFNNACKRYASFCNGLQF